MLTIRLSRIGKKNKPMYRLIISEKGRDPYGRALEILGSYNPHTKELQVKADRIKYWLSQGSGMSPTVNNLLIKKKIIEGKKIKASRAKKRKKDKKEKHEKKPEKKATEPISDKTEEINKAPETPEKITENKEKTEEKAKIEEKKVEDTDKKEEKPKDESTKKTTENTKDNDKKE